MLLRFAIQPLYSLDIEDGVGWVHRSLVLGRLTDQSLLFGEGNERRRGEATLLVGDWVVVSVCTFGLLVFDLLISTLVPS